MASFSRTDFDSGPVASKTRSDDDDDTPRKDRCIVGFLMMLPRPTVDHSIYRSKYDVKFCLSLLVFIASLANFVRVHQHLFLPCDSRPRRLSTRAEHPRTRLLYIVTSIHEYDNGKRATKEGYDRFQNTLLPVVRESTQSMIDAGFNVDLYLIAHYNVTQERMRELVEVLPASVGVQVWSDATPFGYELETSKERIMPITRSLARQHRYVIKDYFPYYDIFLPFEDDMIIKGSQVKHFQQTTSVLERLRKQAPEALTGAYLANPHGQFWGPMSQLQLERVVPGFIRVEAALPGYKPHKATDNTVPIDYDWNGKQASLSAECCTVSAGNEHIPKAPPVTDLYFWETKLEYLRLRQLPNDAWAVLQAGNVDLIWKNPHFVIGGYWADQSGYLGMNETERPDLSLGQFANNQGGWMATANQLFTWHKRWCRGGFLPPYNPPYYEYDGLDTRTVEYWSGGIHIAGAFGCNMQRIILLDPESFSMQLLYHSSNNKQRQRNIQYRFSPRNIQEFWGQLNAIRKKAEEEKNRQAKTMALGKPVETKQKDSMWD